MAQISKISGSNKMAKIARIIQQAKIQAKIWLIFLSKNKPKTMRNTIISPLLKKLSNSFILIGDGVMLPASSTVINLLGFLTIANN